MGRADLRSGVRPGPLYSALHQMADEGLIEPVRTGQSGKTPARPVRAITAGGQRERPDTGSHGHGSDGVSRLNPPGRLAPDAGVPLRDVQEAASHADPRTTMRYDRARTSLDRHATYIVAALIAGAAR
jgi:DNA-binding PadR family transcriptional regulator